MRTSYAFRDIEIVVHGQLVEGQLSGEWEVTGMGIGGQWSTIAEGQSEPAGEQHPAAGVWNLTLQGLNAIGLPTDEAPIALEVIADGSTLEGVVFMAMGRDAEVEDLREEDGILEGTVMATGMEIQLEANLFGDEAEGVWIIPEVAEGEFLAADHRSPKTMPVVRKPW